MNPNELRRNNLIMYGNMIYPVDRITETSISVRLSSQFLRTARPHEFEPVALTPEILQAAGLEEDKEDAQIFNYKSVYLYYSLKGNNFNLWRDDDSIQLGICLCDNIKFLHQLQNFIFVYTGTELTINLEKVKA